MKKYELIVIGTGPAGEKAAVKAAYFRHKTAIIEKSPHCGGAGVNTGTLPSKTLRETALYLSGKYDKGLYGIDRDIMGEASVDHFLYRKNYVVKTEEEEVRKNLSQHHVDLYQGVASFKNEHEIEIGGKEVIYGDNILIATGSYPVHPENIPFDGKRIHDSDTILDIKRFPKSIVILGAGVIGLEYATIFSTMGTKVYLLNRSDKILTFIDKEIVSELLGKMKEEKMELVINDAVQSFDTSSKESEPIKVTLASGKVLEADMFLYAAGRNGNVKDLHLEKVGIEHDNRENIAVNKNFQTKVPNIYAVGDVIGFPALGSTGMDQGRVAVARMFNTKDIEEVGRELPYGIYTIPEISTIGLTEEEAISKKINHGVGIARHKNMPRGKIMGATSGLLKLVFTKDDLVVVGVHIIGPLATEMIHYGASLIQSKRTLNHLIGSVYNFPTLHELYKYAAYDGLGNVAGYKIKQ